MNRLIFQYFARQVVWWASAIVPLSAAGIWTVWPALNAVVATWTADPLPIGDGDWLLDPPLLEQRRSLQQHFLARDLYVPLSDIVIGLPPVSSGLPQPTASLLMQKVCGPSTLYIWIPLRFRFPLMGEQVWEWCWKPPVTKT